MVNEEKDLIYKIDIDGRYRLLVPGNATPDMIYLYHSHTEVNHPGRDETSRALKQK